MERHNLLHDESLAARILSMTSDTLLLLTIDGTCVDMIVKTENNPYVNDECSLLGKNVFEYFPEETLCDLKPAIEHVVCTGEVSNANYNLPSENKMYYFKCIIQKFDDTHILCQYRDITQRSQMKLRLQKANERSIETERTDKIGYWIYNTVTDAFRYSGYVNILDWGEKEIEITLEDYTQYIHPEDRDVLCCMIRTTCPSLSSIDYRIMKDNKTYFLRAKILKSYDENGVRMVEGYTQNINDIVEKWDDLEMITQALNKSNDCIYATDTEGNMVFANRICRKRNYISQSDDVTQYKAYNVLRFFTGKRMWNHFVSDLRANNNSLKYISKYEFPDFNIISSDCTSYVVRNRYGQDIIWNFRQDISERIRYEQELTKAKEKAEESDRLKSAFLSNMSHEIRTPLNAIVGFSAIIADTNNYEDRKKYYEYIESNNNRLLTLINEVLDLSKIESGALEFVFAPVNLTDLMTEVCTMHQVCPAKAKLIFDQPEEDISIETDKNRLIQVVSNLINNAIKFTPQGLISCGYTRKGDFVEVYVKDTGIGIDRSKLGSIFDRFVKVDTFAPGTGLGLSICKTIVERLGGYITVTSEKGLGSEFVFGIPSKTININSYGQKVEENNSLINGSKGMHEKQTILVAEDIDYNFELIKVMIASEYRLLYARDGLETVEIYEKYRPHLILMDIKMPVVDGLEATRMIRQKGYDCPIIAVSACAYEEEKKYAFDSGCNDFLAKPLNRELLITTIRKYI